jgi:CDP-glycerol glycerophosphotransferase
MKENGGFIVDDSEEGLVYGMNQALQGKVRKMKVDYKKYNNTALKQFEELFE